MGDVDLQVIKKACNTRSHHIKQLKNLAEEIDLLLLKYNQDKIKGSGTSLVGGSLAVTSGILTITTGGLAVPILAGIGTVTGVLGGVWNFTSEKTKNEKEKEILQRIKNLVEDDNSLQEEIRHEISKFEMLDDGKRAIVLEQIFTILRGWGGVALVLGPEAAMLALTASLVPIGALFTNIPLVMASLGLAAQGGQAWFTKVPSMFFYPDFILILSRFYLGLAAQGGQAWSTEVPSIFFYPDLTLISSRFYPGFIQILSGFHPYFIQILS